MYAPRTQGPWLPQSRPLGAEPEEPETTFNIEFIWESDEQQYGGLMLTEYGPGDPYGTNIVFKRVYAVERNDVSPEDQYLRAYERLLEIIEDRTAKAAAKKNLLDIAKAGGHYNG